MRTTPLSRASILIVDDKPAVRKFLQNALNGARRFYFGADATQALDCFKRHPVDLVFLEIWLRDMHGIDLLTRLKRLKPHTPIILTCAVQDIQTAVNAMKAGAFDLMSKPFDSDRVQSLARKALVRQSAHVRINGHRDDETLPVPDSMLDNLYRLFDCLSSCDSNVLIKGAGGTLKRIIARAVHERSSRGGRPYLTVNCAARPAKRMEKDLFGSFGENADRHRNERPGLIAGAHTGTLFLNNINYLSLENQARLLRTIQKKKIRASRTQRRIGVDVRFIAATDQDLKALVDARLFRADLYACLNTLPINLPLLCERGGDLGLLIEHFFKQTALLKGEPYKPFSPCTQSALMACDWPGNVREFEHLLERFCRTRRGRALRPADPPIRHPEVHSQILRGLELKKATRAFERQYIVAALKAAGGSRARAARHLGIHRNTLRMKTKALGIDL